MLIEYFIMSLLSYIDNKKGTASILVDTVPFLLFYYSTVYFPKPFEMKGSAMKSDSCQ